MAQWLRKINIVKEWEEVNEKEDHKSLAALCGKLVECLDKLAPLGISELDKSCIGLSLEFGDLECNCTETEDYSDLEFEFNELFEQLYDWGDISLDGKFNGKKNCWIKTF